MDLEKLEALIKLYENRSIDDFFAIWRKLAPLGKPTNSASSSEVAHVDAALVDDYVARLQSPRDADAALTGIGNDKRLRARECIEIAARLAPTAPRPRSRNRALQAIRRRHRNTGVAVGDHASNRARHAVKTKLARHQDGSEPHA